MNNSNKLPFWLRRVDLPLRGQPAAVQPTELNWEIVRRCLISAAGLAFAVFVLSIADRALGIVGVALVASIFGLVVAKHPR